ncbi:MAG: HAD hydrolase-like protein [Mogibacterium sp.]|nr:HAD hydrolase-like protein [Mogibacterium sp.]
MKYKYYLFDLDGTLTDSGIGITNSVMYALEKFGIHVSDRKELYPFIGPPLTDSFRKYYGFNEKDALQAVEYYREYFRAGGIFENAVYEGIPEMLRELKRRNATVALATSKPYEFTVQILDHFDLRQYFDHVGAATMDGRISSKADVIRQLLDKLGITDRSTVLMIGDRDQDIDGAKANDLHCAGVLWGYGSIGELTNAGADYIASVPSDILSL